MMNKTPIRKSSKVSILLGICQKYNNLNKFYNLNLSAI